MTQEPHAYEVGDMLVHVNKAVHDGVFVIIACKWNGATLLDVASGEARWWSWNSIEWHFKALRVSTTCGHTRAHILKPLV